MAIALLWMPSPPRHLGLRRFVPVRIRSFFVKPILGLANGNSSKVICNNNNDNDNEDPVFKTISERSNSCTVTTGITETNPIGYDHKQIKDSEPRDGRHSFVVDNSNWSLQDSDGIISLFEDTSITPVGQTDSAIVFDIELCQRKISNWKQTMRALQQQRRHLRKEQKYQQHTHKHKFMFF